MTDLVERLRILNRRIRQCGIDGAGFIGKKDFDTCNEAADEIERLRHHLNGVATTEVIAENHVLRAEIERLRHQRDQAVESAEYWRGRALEKNKDASGDGRGTQDPGGAGHCTGGSQVPPPTAGK